MKLLIENGSRCFKSPKKAHRLAYHQCIFPITSSSTSCLGLQCKRLMERKSVPSYKIVCHAVLFKHTASLEIPGTRASTLCSHQILQHTFLKKTCFLDTFSASLHPATFLGSLQFCSLPKILLITVANSVSSLLQEPITKMWTL